MKRRPYTLIINRSDSKCGHCGRGANPSETHHNTVINWGTTEPGCGVRWVMLSSDYCGMERYVPQMRPDLAWDGGPS